MAQVWRDVEMVVRGLLVECGGYYVVLNWQSHVHEVNHLTWWTHNPFEGGSFVIQGCFELFSVKLLPLPQPSLRARTDTRTNPSTQRAIQLRSVLARVYTVSRQNQITTTAP
jgi:hypothetical protein